MNDLSIRKAIARAALDGMTEIDPAALETLSEGLALAPSPLHELAQPLSYQADALKYEDVGGALAELSMARALRLIVRDAAGCAELIERLEPLDRPPWQQIREALVALSALDTPRERTLNRMTAIIETPIGRAFLRSPTCVLPDGIEARTLEVLVKASQGDLGSIADSGMNDISARLYTRPSWLFLPEPD